jgi:pyruvate/2-oxoglutarate/acetoin dehydrogenase E1 component
MTTSVLHPAAVNKVRSLSYREALREAMRGEFARDPDVFMMGEDIGAHGGIYAVTKGLYDEFGPSRVIDTPIAEAGFVGAAIGAAMTGKRPIVELMFIDFALVAADQMLNQAAKMRFISGDGFKVPLTIRTQQGVGAGTGAQHGQSLEALFMHVPGFAIAVPSTAADAKGLLTTAIRMDDPVLVIEHKALYGVKDDVPEGEYVLPFGQAAVRRAGTDVTLISYSYAMLPTQLAADKLAAEHGVSAEVIDLRTLVPLDWDTLVASVAKTRHAVVVHEAYRRAGAGAEIAAELTERAWGSLAAPVQRLGGLDIPVPFSPALEEKWQVQPDDIVAAALRSLGR